MTVALWIIAIVETIRMIEQSLQLRLIANDTKGRDNLYDEMIKSFKATDREYVKNLLEAFERQSDTDCALPKECKECDKHICVGCANQVLKERWRKAQTERIKTPDYCDICNHKGCGNCTANSHDDYCVPSGYEPITKTKTQI